MSVRDLAPRAPSTRARAACALGAALLIVIAWSDRAASQQAGGSRADPAGTGSIAGMILTDDDPPRPLRRTVVTITEAASAIQPRVVTSDEDGRYVFRGLPAGRYSVSATRAPYLRGTYGATRVARPGAAPAGTIVVLDDRQQIAGIDIVMVRGSVITGTVRDVNGEPALSARVTAYYVRRVTPPGDRPFVVQTSATTNDRGEYRLFGLAPGDYFVGVVPTSTDAAITTDAELARAAELLQGTGVASATSLAARNVPAGGSSAAAPQLPRRPAFGYAPVFFPGTTDTSLALAVTLGLREERSGIDLTMQLVPMARIDGIVTENGGPPTRRLQIFPGQDSALPQTFSGYYGADDEGRFTLRGLAPGRYTIEARTPRSESPAPGDAEPLWASVDVRLSGDDQSAVLELRPGLTVSGRIVFEGVTRKPPADLTRVIVNLVPDKLVGPGHPTIRSGARGEFEIPGVPSGRYRLDAALPVPSIESGWYLASATINGQETLDHPVDLRAARAVAQAEITMTDQPSELSGTMTDANGRPAPEYHVIVFAVDRSFWTYGSRRIVQTRPFNDGSFVIRNLPAGAYRLAAVTDVEPNEWFDPAFLAQLLDASVPITITERGKHRQDLRIAGTVGPGTVWACGDDCFIIGG